MATRSLDPWLGWKTFMEQYRSMARPHQVHLHKQVDRWGLGGVIGVFIIGEAVLVVDALPVIKKRRRRVQRARRGGPRRRRKGGKRRVQGRGA